MKIIGKGKKAVVKQKKMVKKPVKKEVKKPVPQKPVERVIKFDHIVKTPIDELFELVEKNGKVKMSDAAKNFNVKRDQIEEWAKILEEHGLLEIRYPPIGDPELRKNNLEKEKMSKKKRGN